MNRFARLHIDKPLFYGLLALAVVSLLVVYSASGQNLGQLVQHAIRLLLGFGLMFALAQLRPEVFARIAPFVYFTGIVLLGAVLAVGSVSKGAQRWLDLGIVSFQPSEMMKLGVPLMLAWYFSRRPLPPNLLHVAVGAMLMLVPTLLIAKQPDLGTAGLTALAGMAVLFIAGMSWHVIITVLVSFAAAIPVLWNFLHDYQRQRVLTLLDPQSDPLGTGYHTIQAMIAVGSGGIYGKGWLNSTQAHLDFLPEAATDFIFAVFAEEFGLIGILALFALYAFIVVRGLMIAFYAQDSFNRLLAGGVTLIFFFYFFINVGMVAGILPVVGVPLPLVSYGGTAIVTLMTAFGMLMSIQTHRKITA